MPPGLRQLWWWVRFAALALHRNLATAMHTQRSHTHKHYTTDRTHTIQTHTEPLDDARAVQAALFEAMLAAPWGPGDGLPDDVTPGSEYAELVATPPGEAVQRCMGGVEPIDDVSRIETGVWVTLVCLVLFVSLFGAACGNVWKT